MIQAKQGDTVKVHYTGKLMDGTIFDSSEDREPLEFTIGAGQIIPGFEEAVVGMQPNESKVVNIKAENAYGPHRDDLVVSVPEAQFPMQIEPQVGDQVEVKMQNGDSRLATVAQVKNQHVTLDINHVLAGKDLKFDILLVEIA